MIEYKIELTKEIKEALLKKIWINEKGETCLSLGNSRLDFEKTYIFLGFRGKTQVLLGEFYNREIHNSIGYVMESDQCFYKLWTDVFNYSMKFEVTK